MRINVSLSLFNNWCWSILGESNARQSTPTPSAPEYIDAAAYFGMMPAHPGPAIADRSEGPALLPTREPIGRRG